MPQDPLASRSPSRVLLAGCGALGTRLGSLLIGEGSEVFALRRTTTDLPGDFTTLAVDLRRPVTAELPDVDSLVITLPPGGTADRRPATGQPQRHDDGYLASMRHLAAALPRVPQRVVMVSSTRVFDGITDGRPLTEEDEPAPATPRAHTLREGELLAADLFGAHILRPAGIYGPGREMLLRKVLGGTPVQYLRRTNRIHEDDVVRTLHALLLAQDPPQLLHATDRCPASLGDVVTHIAERLGVAPPPRLHPEQAAGTILDGTRLLGVLGSLRHPTYQSGYDQLIAERGDAGSVQRG